jgi:hypothetical protein
MTHPRLHDGRNGEPWRHQALARRPARRFGVRRIAPHSLCNRRSRRRPVVVRRHAGNRSPARGVSHCLSDESERHQAGGTGRGGPGVIPVLLGHHSRRRSMRPASAARSSRRRCQSCGTDSTPRSHLPPTRPGRPATGGTGRGARASSASFSDPSCACSMRVAGARSLTPPTRPVSSKSAEAVRSRVPHRSRPTTTLQCRQVGIAPIC